MAGNENSGRKKKKIELQVAVEEITARALAKLARSKVKKYLDAELTFEETKEMALPIALRDMAQKLGNDPDNPLPVIPIYGGQSIQGYNSNPQNIPTVQED